MKKRGQVLSFLTNPVPNQVILMGVQQHGKTKKGFEKW
jgi:hypothetical protein